MEVEHFSHPDHPLILMDQVLEYIGEHVICSGCEEPISGPCYSCNSCFFFLHKKCVELPREIKRHWHPSHPLVLLAKPPPHYTGSCFCDLCEETCESFVYHCDLCQFDLDIHCALPPCLFEVEGKGHQFRCLLSSFPFKSLSFTCNACGTDGDERPFMCTTCQLVVHKKCISLRPTINIRQHPHSLTHTYFPHESGKSYCGVCKIRFKSGHGGYHCKDCNFFAHVNCALEYIGSFSTSWSITTYNESMDSSTPTSALEIEHFSHQHSLILMNEFKDNMICSACILPISNPFYGCSRCAFFLHKACSELPKYLEFSGDLLTLFSRYGTVDGIFYCFLCSQYRHGFFYTHDIEFQSVCCVGCASIASSGTITHEGHSHQLFLYEGRRHKRCSACSGVDSQCMLRCGICDFNLDFRCATLPLEARHEYDEHPLFLTYIDPNDYQFVCQICEKERDPNLWFYRCEECDFDAHPECALGKYPYIKLGGSYTYRIHHHPLVLVQKTELDHPACHTCGESCDDLALECTDSGCNFIIHKKARCLYLSFK